VKISRSVRETRLKRRVEVDSGPLSKAVNPKHRHVRKEAEEGWTEVWSKDKKIGVMKPSQLGKEKGKGIG